MALLVRFVARFLACMVAVLSLSVLAAMAWDGSDAAAAAQHGERTGTP